MKRLFLTSAFGAATALALAAAAQAGPIEPTLSLGYALNGGTPQTAMTGQGFVSVHANNASEKGVISGVTDFGQYVDFDFSIQGGAKFSSPLSIYLTESGLTGTQIQSIEGQLVNTTNFGTPATSIVYALYGSSTDQLYGGTLLGSTTLYGNNSGSIYAGAFDTGTGLYSLTQEITINPSASGTTNVSLDGNVNVPEPGSLALLGSGLVALGLIIRRRRTRT